jgi:hypothetical protein
MRNLLAVLMVILWVSLMFVLAGCAGKGLRLEVETEGGATQTKKVKLLTDYQIENGLHIKRNTETGDYEIELGSATTKDADPGLWMLMSQMLQMMQAVLMPGVPIIAPPAPAGGEP